MVSGFWMDFVALGRVWFAVLSRLGSIDWMNQ